MIRFITTQETYPLRHRILRPGRAIETCYWDGDDLTTTKHIGYTDHDEIIGILSLYLSPLPEQATLITDLDTWQLRGMAIAQSAQGKGVGNSLIQFTVEYMQKFKPCILWCNARQTAIGFYEKNGFAIISDEFIIPDVGPHKIMAYRI